MRKRTAALAAVFLVASCSQAPPYPAEVPQEPKLELPHYAGDAGGNRFSALTQIDNISPNLGQNYIIDSFMVVVFGGVGNLWGTLVGALTLGVANKFLEPYAGAVLGKILILVLIILFIQRRPRGLFALKGRAVEQ